MLAAPPPWILLVFPEDTGSRLGYFGDGIASATKKSDESGPGEVMTTKDYIYVGLILLTALAFYCNGFYAGVYRCKRMYDTLLDDAEYKGQSSPSMPEEAKFLAKKEKVLAFRESDIRVAGRELRGDFGNN